MKLTEEELDKLLKLCVSEGKSIKKQFPNGWDKALAFRATTPAAAAYTGELFRRALRKGFPNSKLPKKAYYRIKYFDARHAKKKPKSKKRVDVSYESIYSDE